MGVFAGSVTTSTGEVLAGVLVVAVSTGTAEETSTTTDDHGTFRTPVLPAGTYRLVARHAGFADEHLPDVELRDGDEVAEVPTVVLLVAAVITGRVSGPGGGVPPGGRVRVKGPRGVSVVDGVEVDGDGAFTLTGLHPGIVRVLIDPPAGLLEPEPVRLRLEEGETARVEFLLEAEPAVTAVSGRVLDAVGAGLAGVTVEAVPAASGAAVSARTGESGEYLLTGLAAGAHTVSVTGQHAGPFVPAANVTVTAGRTTTGIDFAADPVTDLLGRLDDQRCTIDSPVSLPEAREAVALFAVASLVLAGRRGTAAGGGVGALVDVLGVVRIHDGLADPGFPSRIGVPTSPQVWEPVVRAVTALHRTLQERRSELDVLTAEAARQFGLGAPAGEPGATVFPDLFRRYVEIGTHPLLGLDLAAESRAGSRADRTQLAAADRLLVELLDVVLAIVRELSVHGTVSTRQLSADWSLLCAGALEVLAELAAHRVDPHDVDASSQWALLAQLTGVDRATGVAPHVALARAGRHLLEIAVEVHEATADDLERRDAEHLRSLLQGGDDPSARVTARIARAATQVARYPLRRW